MKLNRASFCDCQCDHCGAIIAAGDPVRLHRAPRSWQRAWMRFHPDCDPASPNRPLSPTEWVRNLFKLSDALYGLDCSPDGTESNRRWTMIGNACARKLYRDKAV